MVSTPRVVLGAGSSDSGKTTVAVGLMSALRARGLAVAPFKVGPDYIDPGYHALATGRAGRNLDAHLCGEDLIPGLFEHGTRTPAPADVAVVEGVMGLFDGKLGTRGFGSTAHIARLLRAPVVLVLDASHSSRTVGAVAHGLATFDPSLDVAGVICNQAGSPRAQAELTTAISDAGLVPLGCLPRTPDVVLPSRHLGLIPAAERAEGRAAIDVAGRIVAEHLDLDALLRIARTAPDLDARWEPTEVVSPVGAGATVAVVTGRAFTFRYAETSELLQAAGCRVVEVDPLADAHLPADTDALYIGGGFPEVFAAELSANAALRSDVAARIRTGLPTVAECAGLLYLCRSLDGLPMAGVVELDAAMTTKLTLGYHCAVARVDTLLARAGESVTAHEFHRTAVTPTGPEPAWAWDIAGRGEGISADPAGIGEPTLLASYQHLHWAADPRLVERFAAAAARHRARRD